MSDTASTKNVVSQSAASGCWSRWMHAAAQVVFPPFCVLCRTKDDLSDDDIALCQSCRRVLMAASGPSCPRCAMPLPGAASLQPRCEDCRDKRLFFSRAYALQRYAGAIRQFVLRLKQPGNDALAITAGRLLADWVRESGGDADIDWVAPVPLHWFRRLTRGYHAADLLAHAVAKRLGRPLADDLLYCRRWTSRQSGLLPDERRANVRRAFGVASRFPLRNTRVLLVDDVITTGATAASIARALRATGALEVRVAAVARATGE